ncbi:MAG: hypothetical protein K2Y31_15665 [Burkholderiales bacterium]|jgi:hypothetical protein|nr:hypothetical protein [Burkholderiales bacterium]
MWITLKIGMFYGAPILAVVLAMLWFVMLLLRVRRGQLRRSQAALRYVWALVLPVFAVLLIWLTGEIAGYFSSSVERFVWDAELSLQLLLGLLPLGFYVGAAILVLQLLFWIALSLIRVRH